MSVLSSFGSMNWVEPDWKLPSVSDKNTKKMLLQCVNVSKTQPPYNIQEIHENIKSFPIPFPTTYVRLKALSEQIANESLIQSKLEKNIMSTYPIIHERALILMAKFLLHKRKYGSHIEKACYKNMTIPQFIDRLLTKRAVSFLGSQDWYQLLSGEEGRGGWESIGTLEEKPPLLLQNCLSYDEMKVSAMVYVSGYTECFDDGKKECENEAVIIGLIGPRFLRRYKMDFEDIIIVDDPNNPPCFDPKPKRPGWFYTRFLQSEDERKKLEKEILREVWEEFYESPTCEFYDFISNHIVVEKSFGEVFRLRFRYVPETSDTEAFDKGVYYKRISILAETLLIEAENRAKECGRNAFVNVVGCGLETWLLSEHLSNLYVLIFLDRLSNFLDNGMLKHITDINFSHIKTTSKIIKAIFSNTIKENDGSPEIKQTFLYKSETHPNGGINVQMQNREPLSKLTGEHMGKLLVTNYPADSNSLPGNEFWQGSPNVSEGAAAASSTQISELHNPHINPAVNGNNVRVVGKHGLKSLSEYCVALTSIELV